MNQDALSPKPRLGISSCLLGQEVRYDGAHKRNSFLTGSLADHVEWVPVCPEVEVGMGVPREPVRLVWTGIGVAMVGVQSGRDWTGEMEAYARAKAEELVSLNLSGYVFKAGSPSCGLSGVSVANESDGVVSAAQAGLFANALVQECPKVNSGPGPDVFAALVGGPA